VPFSRGTKPRHDRAMRMPWSEPKAKQLELLDAEPDAPHDDG
jgi:hypothetical protein